MADDKKGGWLFSFWDSFVEEIMGSDFMKAFQEGIKMWKEFYEWGKGVLSDFYEVGKGAVSSVDDVVLGGRGKGLVNWIGDCWSDFWEKDSKFYEKEFEEEKAKKAAETPRAENQSMENLMKGNPLALEQAKQAAASLNQKKESAGVSSEVLPPEEKKVKFAKEDEIQKFGLGSKVQGLKERREKESQPSKAAQGNYK